MHSSFLLKGLILGFSIAAPVGPIGLLCIRRTLAEGRACGLISGLGAATADMLYGAVAAFGLTFISHFLTRQQAGLRLVGGLFLCYLGGRIFSSTPSQGAAAVKARGLAGAYLSTFFLTITNPLTILSFAAIFAGLGVGMGQGSGGDAGTLVLGVFAGSALWWLVLSSVVGLFRSRLSTRRLQWVNRGAGLLIAAFGLVAIAAAARTR